MRPEFRDVLLQSVDQAMAFAGEADYAVAMQKATSILAMLQSYVEMIKTKEDLIATLDKAGEIPLEQELYVVALLQNISGIARSVFVEQLPKVLADSLPPAAVGRKKTLTVIQRIKICDHISDLYRKGCTSTDL